MHYNDQKNKNYTSDRENSLYVHDIEYIHFSNHALLKLNVIQKKVHINIFSVPILHLWKRFLSGGLGGVSTCFNPDDIKNLISSDSDVRLLKSFLLGY